MTSQLYQENFPHLTPALSRIFNFVADRAEGSYIYTDDGKKLLDFTSGIGWDLTLDELMEVGRKDDQLPKKFFKPLAGTGPTAGFALTHEEVDSAIDIYYRLAGLNSDGAPTPQTLEKLDLAWAI